MQTNQWLKLKIFCWKGRTTISIVSCFNQWDIQAQYKRTSFCFAVEQWKYPQDGLVTYWRPAVCSGWWGGTGVWHVPQLQKDFWYGAGQCSFLICFVMIHIEDACLWFISCDIIIYCIRLLFYFKILIFLVTLINIRMWNEGGLHYCMTANLL